MIKAFEVGKLYACTVKERPLNWNPEGKMDYVLDHQIYTCVSVIGNNGARFIPFGCVRGQTDMPAGAFSNWIWKRSEWEEIVIGIDQAKEGLSDSFRGVVSSVNQPNKNGFVYTGNIGLSARGFNRGKAVESDMRSKTEYLSQVRMNKWSRSPAIIKILRTLFGVFFRSLRKPKPVFFLRARFFERRRIPNLELYK